MEVDDEGVDKLIHAHSKLCVDSIKLGSMSDAAKSLEDLIEIMIQRYDEKQNEVTET